MAEAMSQDVPTHQIMSLDNTNPVHKKEMGPAHRPWHAGGGGFEGVGSPGPGTRPGVARGFVADKIGFAPRPDQASWPEIWGVSILCGIGFTMSLFISGLAFTGQQLLINEAKIGILLGSLISAIVGYTILRMSAQHPDDMRSPYID